MELDPWPELVRCTAQMRVDWAQARVGLDEEWTREGSLPWATPWMLSKKRSTTHRVTMLWSTMHERPSGKQAAEAFIWAGSKPTSSWRLAEGTRLVHEEGKQGLKRWVLLMEDGGKIPDEEALTSWLASVGVPDAYEVQWDKWLLR